MNWFRSSLVLGVAALLLMEGSGWGAQRFPPPEFESGYQLPATTTPPARSLVLEYLDTAVLLGALGLATWLVYRKRSRRGLAFLGAFSILYFGFFRLGCVCAIGSIQNVALAFGDPSYGVPLSVLVFFAAPLIVSLVAGRTFCAGVCPHGALQDLVLIKPVKLPSWLEQGLGVVPFVYLGAAVLFAATGAAFIVCRYDPFIALFRMSGSHSLLLLGGVFLVVSMFVGRPYCRFLCPYGALLNLGARAAKWRVRVTPTLCTQCRLCEASCPFGAMREPSPASQPAPSLSGERKRLGWMVIALPALVVAGGWIGSQLSVPASRLHPAVALAETHLRHQETPIEAAPQTATALALHRAAQNPAAILQEATRIRRGFVLGGWLFGAWSGLVIALKLIGLSIRQKRLDYEPDRATCFACARCFKYCPEERARLGLEPLTPEPVPASAPPSNPAGVTS